jgi:hypothetical protein
MVFEDFSKLPIPQLAEKADVVVYGRVASVRSHLTVDETMVVTDIAITPMRMLKESTAVTSRPLPGQTHQIVVRHVGGTVAADGLKVTAVVNMFPPNEELVPSEEVLCFLVYDRSAGVFGFADGPFAAFRVEDGVARLLTKDAAERSERPRTSSLTDLLSEVERAVRASKSEAQ